MLGLLPSGLEPLWWQSACACGEGGPSGLYVMSNIVLYGAFVSLSNFGELAKESSERRTRCRSRSWVVLGLSCVSGVEIP